MSAFIYNVRTGLIIYTIVLAVYLVSRWCLELHVHVALDDGDGRRRFSLQNVQLVNFFVVIYGDDVSLKIDQCGIVSAITHLFNYFKSESSGKMSFLT